MKDDFFTLSYLVGWVVQAVIRVGPVQRCRKAVRVFDRRRRCEIPLLVLVFLGTTGIPLVYIFSSWLDFADYSLPRFVGWTGVVLLAAGVVIIARAHHDLGRNFSTEPVVVQDHQLITGGIYRYIRHPMYAGFWLVVAAQALLLSNGIAGPAGLVTFFFFYGIRIAREEKMLEDYFGDAYRDYARRTGRLWPRLVSRKN